MNKKPKRRTRTKDRPWLRLVRVAEQIIKCNADSPVGERCDDCIDEAAIAMRVRSQRSER